MNVYSYEARLKTLNPSFRLWKRKGWTLYDGTIVSPVGMYIGRKYSGFCFDSHFINKKSTPLRKARNKDTGQVLVVQRRRRGREMFLRLLIGHKLITHTWEKQLLSL